MKHISKIFSAAFVFAALFLLGAGSAEAGKPSAGGCLADDTENPFAEFLGEREPKYVISIHEIIKYKRGADMLEQDVDSFFGTTMTVNKNYFLHSKDVEKVELLKRVSSDNAEFYDLALTLTDRGHKLWSAISITTRLEGKQLGVLIDGMFYRVFKAEMLMDDKTRLVTVEGPFDPATARGIKNNAPFNYKFYNKL